MCNLKQRKRLRSKEKNEKTCCLPDFRGILATMYVNERIKPMQQEYKVNII